MNIFAGALTPCALFAIGLGLSAEGLRTNLNASIALAAIKLVIMPLIVYALCLLTKLDPLNTIAAVICAAVPTAKTVYHPGRRVQGGGGTGRVHGVDHDAAVGGDADGMAVCAVGAWGAGG